MKPVRRSQLAGLACVLATLAAFAIRPALFEQGELALLDWRFRLRGAREIATPVTVVAIDAASIDAFGRWPWRRDRIAELITRLSEQGARAIGVDVTFSEPEDQSSRAALLRARDALTGSNAPEAAGATPALREIERALDSIDTDAALERAIAASDRVVLGYLFRTEASASPYQPEGAAASALARGRVSVNRIPVDSRAPLLGCSGVETSLPRFHAVARRAAFLSSLRDADGVVRRAPLLARCGGEVYVSLPLALAELLAGSRATVLGDPARITELRLGARAIATDEGGRSLIPHVGPAGSVPIVSAADVLTGRADPAMIRDRAVLVGVSEVGLSDLVATPFGRSVPGVEVHAAVLDGLLSGETLVRDDRLIALELGVALSLAALLAFAVPRMDVRSGALFSGATALLLVVANALAFTRAGLWLNLIYPSLALTSTYLAVTVVDSISRQSRERFLRRAFATYVPPAVVSEIARAPEKLGLGGVRRDLSMLFSDVRGFTGLSERLGPEGTAKLMNAYLTPMTRIVFDTDGTLDKYIGDAIVAFWNAPLAVPAHPELACRAALAMQREAARLRRELGLPGSEDLFAGIGIHCAVVVVGNLGSDQRFDYSMTGDGVNLCSRLEALTRRYGVEILASEEIAMRAGAEFAWRELDRVRVKGRGAAIAIGELFDASQAEAPAKHVLDCYASALVEFRAGRFERAARAFESADRERPGGDPPAQLLAARSAALATGELGLADDWDGAWTYDSK